MPTKPCPICGRIQTIPREDWKYVSQLPNVICSRSCAWAFIETRPSGPNYLRVAQTNLEIDSPSECYSDLLGEFFRSKYELYVAEALSENGIKFEYEKWAFPISRTAFWTPDFHLPEERLFIEVKGPWGVSAKTKILSFLDRYPKVSLLILPWSIHKEFYPDGIC